MKKILLLSINCVLFLSMPLFGQQKDKNENSNGNTENGRINLLLPHGNIGINTLTPSERLEVIGNVKVSNSIFANELEVVGLSSGNITVREDVRIGRNLYISGNVGIGVVQPNERLEINGNLRVSNTVFSDGIEVNLFTGNNGTFNNNLIVNENFTVSGFTGFGVAAPKERLEVAGNLKVSQGIFTNTLEGSSFTIENGIVNNQLQVKGNTLIDGNLGVGNPSPAEKVDIVGNIKASGNLTANDISVHNGNFGSDVKIQRNLDVAGTSNLTGQVTTTNLVVANTLEGNIIQGTDATFGRNLSVVGLSNFQGDVTANNLTVQSNLQSDALTSNNGNIYNSLSVGGNTVINGNTGLGVAEPIEKLEVAGNIKVSGNLLSESFSAKEGVFSQHVNVGQSLTVAGTSDFTGKVTTHDLTVLNTLNLKNGLSLGSKLGIGVATPEASLHVAGDGKFEGNITAVKLIVQELEVANLDLSSQQGGQISFDDNLLVKGRIGIGTEMVDGYGLSVKGKIRASDDIKVYPATEWADYVFAEDYKLLSIKEVSAYIHKNKHLPEMPSASEVKKEGIQLGEMDALLLQKIEELTLYVIQLEQENEKTRIINTELSRENKELQADIRAIKKALEMR